MKTSRVALGLALAMNAALAAFATFAPPAGAAVRAGTFAYDYRNIPQVSRFEGYEVVILSARGALDPAKVDSVHAWGGRVLALVQPTLAAWHGRPIDRASQYPWDAALWRAARARGAVLRTAAGDTAWMFAGAPHAAALWDLSDSAFAGDVARAITDASGLGQSDGIVLDYGCGGVPVNGIAPETEARWARGWRGLIARMRQMRPEWTIVCQCDRFTEGASPVACDGLLLERVGHSLQPPAKAWQLVTGDSTSRMFLRQEDTVPARRRLFAAIALLTDGYFAQGGDPNAAPSVAQRNPEHWELDLGAPKGRWSTPAPGIYERTFACGHVVANLSNTSYRFRRFAGATFTILPLDALVLQDKNAEGSTIPPRSTSLR